MHRDTLDQFIRNERMVSRADRYAPCNPPEIDEEIETKCGYCGHLLAEGETSPCKLCERDLAEMYPRIKRGHL